MSNPAAYYHKTSILEDYEDIYSPTGLLVSFIRPVSATQIVAELNRLHQQVLAFEEANLGQHAMLNSVQQELADLKNDNYHASIERDLAD